MARCRRRAARRCVGSRVTALYALAAGALAVAAVFALAEPDRSLYSPLALSFLLAGASSTLVALTVTPALSALLLGRPDRSPPRHR